MGLVAFDISALVRYITTFTQESFAVLVGLIFIWEALKKAYAIPDEPGSKATMVNLTIFQNISSIPNNLTQSIPILTIANFHSATQSSYIFPNYTISLKEFTKSSKVYEVCNCSEINALKFQKFGVDGYTYILESQAEIPEAKHYLDNSIYIKHKNLYNCVNYSQESKLTPLEYS